MMEFNRLTVTAAAELVSLGWSRAGMDVLEVQWGIDGRCRTSSKSARAADWARIALNEQPQVMTENGKVSLARAIVETAIKTPAFHRESDTWGRFLAGLRFDGFEVRKKKIESDEEYLLGDSAHKETMELCRMLPESIPGTDMREAEDEITALLDKHEFKVTKGHLAQATAAFSRGDWTAANGQLRNLLESCFFEIAKAIGYGGSDSGKKARDFLCSKTEPPFLSSEYNEPQYVQGLFKRLHPHGGHPGLSEEEDATFRLQIVLVTVRLFLRRFEERKTRETL